MKIVVRVLKNEYFNRYLVSIPKIITEIRESVDRRSGL
jgi:hypothetical protein